MKRLTLSLALLLATTAALVALGPAAAADNEQVRAGPLTVYRGWLDTGDCETAYGGQYRTLLVRVVEYVPPGPLVYWSVYVHNDCSKYAWGDNNVLRVGTGGFVSPGVGNTNANLVWSETNTADGHSCTITLSTTPTGSAVALPCPTDEGPGVFLPGGPLLP